MNTTILALDLGTTTGWAIRLKDGQIISDSETFKPQRFEGGRHALPALPQLAHRDQAEW